MQKRYYRMPELANKFRFDKYDFQYLCENTNVPVNVFSYASYFILAERIPKSLKRTIRGVVSYSGIVELSLRDKSTLLKNKLVVVQTVTLHTTDGIQLLESCSRELLTQMLNDRYEIDYVSRIADLDLSKCDAILINDTNRDMIHEPNTALPKGVTIEFDDLVLKNQLIEWCELQLGINSEKSDGREHLMREQIKLIQKEHSELGGSKLYRLMLDNFQKDDDATDPLSILIEMNRDEIIWGKAGQQEFRMSKKRFLNIFAEVKK
jgi:hypothetical protein